MSAFDNRFTRTIARSRAPYVDIAGTTAATANTAALKAHTLRDDAGKPIVPSFIQLTINSAAAPAGNLYENAAGHTTTQVDIRATGASVPFRARLWL